MWTSEQGFWLLLILLVPKRLFPKRQQTDKPGLPGLHTRTRTSPKAPRRYDFTNDGGEKHIVSICASNDFFDHSIKPPFYVLFIYWWRIQYRREAIFCATGFCNIPRKRSNPVASPNKKLYENVWRSDQDTPTSSEKKWWNLFVEKVICGQVSQFLFHFRLSELIYIYIYISPFRRNGIQETWDVHPIWIGNHSTKIQILDTWGPVSLS